MRAWKSRLEPLRTLTSALSEARHACAVQQRPLSVVVVAAAVAALLGTRLGRLRGQRAVHAAAVLRLLVLLCLAAAAAWLRQQGLHRR